MGKAPPCPERTLDTPLPRQRSSSAREEEGRWLLTEEMKEMEQKRTEEALELVRKENDLWKYQHEKEEAKILQGARRPRKDEEGAWAPPRNMTKWPDCEEARRMEAKRVEAGA